MTVGLGARWKTRCRRPRPASGNGSSKDYHLTPSEIAIVLGSSVEYSIGEVADRNAGIAAKVRKDRLTGMIGNP